MAVILCPGYHPPELTLSFLAELRAAAGFVPNPNYQNPPYHCWLAEVAIFPAQDCPAYSPTHILQFWQEQAIAHNWIDRPVIVISFSAGVVGAIGAAWGWQLQGGKVGGFFAIDGWGVPLGGNFPIHRLSHDSFTHWSSALLGSGEDSFYANPPQEHLEMWQFPQSCLGWHIRSGQAIRQTTAAKFLVDLGEQYGA